MMEKESDVLYVVQISEGHTFEIEDNSSKSYGYKYTNDHETTVFEMSHDDSVHNRSAQVYKYNFKPPRSFKNWVPHRLTEDSSIRIKRRIVDAFNERGEAEFGLAVVDGGGVCSIHRFYECLGIVSDLLRNFVHAIHYQMTYND